MGIRKTLKWYWSKFKPLTTIDKNLIFSIVFILLIPFWNFIFSRVSPPGNIYDKWRRALNSHTGSKYTDAFMHPISPPVQLSTKVCWNLAFCDFKKSPLFQVFHFLFFLTAVKAQFAIEGDKLVFFYTMYVFYKRYNVFKEVFQLIESLWTTIWKMNFWLQPVFIFELGSCSIRAGVLTKEPSLPQCFFPSIAVKKKDGSIIVGIDALSPEV